MMREQEIRSTEHVVEFRAGGTTTTGLGVLTGLIVFNKRSVNLGGFVEVVDPKAFNKTLADRVPVMARFNHDSNLPLGTTTAGTLRLKVQRDGLRYEVDLPDTGAGRDVKALAERGDLRASSFAFRAVEDDWGFTEDNTPLRTLKSVKLVDVAPVMEPAYPDSTTGMRSLADRLGVPFADVERAAAEGELRLLAARAGLPTRTTQKAEPAGPTIAELRRRLDAGLFSG
ncbi:HK97 family phage prohead protease [Arthrobacter sp. B3I4]|uniref:HK97 family phage prohead protease n=1 Tax=Arthrobacter sp. B3I4 TaxID=3042267 RepID=UPI002787D26E|nr:HK97 family phage prohead protease [Arthrobacter sp. B3I4]MDQ0755776.1 HK97 family phage prohead protease [Arthrobacter sp. B3I4]